MLHDPNFEPLPWYTDPREALRKAMPSLRPGERLTVTEAAEKYMKVRVGDQWQPFRRDVTPYMVEPTDMIGSRKFRGLVFVGPSQSGKTQMLQAALAHAIMCDPGRVAFFQMTREAAAEFERNKLSPMIRNSPDLRERQAAGRGADNMYQKLYSGGTQLSLDWPTITKLSSATMRLVLGTDYDHFPESIDGEGPGYDLMRARARSFMSRGMVVVESSPGAPLTDENWRAATPHDSPPVSYGVLSIYPDGTRGRFYWPCVNCGVEFEPTFRRLVYPESADPVEAGEAAEMKCPHCEGTFGHHHKRDLNGQGRWLHETPDGRVVPIDHPDVRRTDLASFWADGAIAAFSTWAELVQQYRQGVEMFDRTGDEEKLKAAYNTGQAQPYLPRSATSETEVTLQGLKDKSRGLDTPQGVAPRWARYVFVSVDVQGTSFSVGATAFGEDGRHQPIDRFDLKDPPSHLVGADRRTLKPFVIAEDWQVLDHLSAMSWPVEGTEWRLKPTALAVDMHGGGSTTENAYAFFRRMRKAGEGRLWHLTRGQGGTPADRVWLKAPERVHHGSRRRVAKDIQILNMATDRLKDAVAASLHMLDGSQNYCAVPEWMDDTILTEFTSERRTKKGWEKRPGMVRNESLDHLVQARALHILLGGEKINWADPVGWAVLNIENPAAIWVGSAEAREIQPPEQTLEQQTSDAEWIGGGEDWL